MKVTPTLAKFIVESNIGDYPGAVVDTAKKVLLDWAGCALGAAGDPSVKLMTDLICRTVAEGQASIMGSCLKTSVFQAALVNGTMSHALDYDDAQSIVRTHPGAPLIPAVLALAERDHLSGARLITSLVMGYEVTIRIGEAVGKEYYEKGWHATSVLGRFGAAVGAAKLLGLDAPRTECAIGLAATQAGGLRDAFGTMAKSFHAGKAAMDGLLSALLAQRGFTGPADILDAKAGFASAFSSEYDTKPLIEDLGGGHRILSTSFKPYAACLLVHPVIDAVVSMRREEMIDPSAISEIRITVAPLNNKVAGNPGPEDRLQAKFSLPFAACLASIHGRANETDFTARTVHDSSIRELMKRVRVEVEDSFGEMEARVRIMFADGSIRERHVTDPKGGPANPMDFQELEAKFTDLATPAIGYDKAEALIESVHGLEDLDDVAKLVRLCCREPQEKCGKQ